MRRFLFLAVAFWLLGGCSDTTNSSSDTATVDSNESADTESDTAPVEIVGWMDLACEESSDCVLMEVPTCCGTEMELANQCVNAAFDPPETVDCSSNTTCAKSIQVTACECTVYESDDTEMPERICVGATPDTESDTEQ